MGVKGAVAGHYLAKRRSRRRELDRSDDRFAAAVAPPFFKFLWYTSGGFLVPSPEEVEEYQRQRAEEKAKPKPEGLVEGWATFKDGFVACMGIGVPITLFATFHPMFTVGGDAGIILGLTGLIVGAVLSVSFSAALSGMYQWSVKANVSEAMGEAVRESKEESMLVLAQHTEDGQQDKLDK